MSLQNETKKTRAGFIGLVGFPNAGKSELLNSLVEEKIAIVSEKAQTTRRRNLGIHSEENLQIVWVDAPGWVKENQKGLNSFLLLELEDVMKLSDVILCVVSLDQKNKSDVEEILDLVAAQKKPWAVLINKVDLKKFQHRIGAIEAEINKRGQNIRVFFRGLGQPDGQVKLRQELADWASEVLPKSEFFYNPDDLTTSSVREIAAELIRESCFENLENELPYFLAVQPMKFQEPSEDDLYRLYYEIILEKENHKPMVIGSRGSMLKKIGQEARGKIEKLLGQRVYLALHVSVRPGWTKDQKTLKELGYVVSKPSRSSP